MEEDKLECISCNKQFDLKIMSCDDDDNLYCPECYEELAPIMKKDYEELKTSGQLD